MRGAGRRDLQMLGPEHIQTARSWKHCIHQHQSECPHRHGHRHSDVPSVHCRRVHVLSFILNCMHVQHVPSWNVHADCWQHGVHALCCRHIFSCDWVQQQHSVHNMQRRHVCYCWVQLVRSMHFWLVLCSVWGHEQRCVCHMRGRQVLFIARGFCVCFVCTRQLLHCIGSKQQPRVRVHDVSTRHLLRRICIIVLH
jgi:hypothetical protein